MCGCTSEGAEPTGSAWVLQAPKPLWQYQQTIALALMSSTQYGHFFGPTGNSGGVCIEAGQLTRCPNGLALVP